MRFYIVCVCVGGCLHVCPRSLAFEVEEKRAIGLCRTTRFEHLFSWNSIFMRSYRRMYVVHYIGPSSACYPCINSIFPMLVAHAHSKQMKNSILICQRLLDTVQAPSKGTWNLASPMGSVEDKFVEHFASSVYAHPLPPPPG